MTNQSVHDDSAILGCFFLAMKGCHYIFIIEAAKQAG